jgi:hypothetical protein
MGAPLEAPLDALQGAALDAAAPMFRALVEAMEAKLAGMHALHAAHWGHGQAEADAGVMDTSGYVADVATALGYFRWACGAGVGGADGVSGVWMVAAEGAAVPALALRAPRAFKPTRAIPQPPPPPPRSRPRQV